MAAPKPKGQSARYNNTEEGMPPFMFEVLSNGTEYRISPIGKIHQGWSVIDSAASLEEGYAASKKDWDRFWNLCGFNPSRPIKVSAV